MALLGKSECARSLNRWAKIFMHGHTVHRAKKASYILSKALFDFFKIIETDVLPDLFIVQESISGTYSSYVVLLTDISINAKAS